MKKIFTSIALSVIISAASSQSVGIGTNTPDPSAALDISGSNKGLLLPRLSLQTENDNTTITNPATGLMIYNNNIAMTKGKGYYYNIGSPASPVWQKIGTSDFNIPYINSANSISALFSLANHGNGMVAAFSSTNPDNMTTMSVSSESTLTNASVIQANMGYSNITVSMRKAVVGDVATGIGIAGLSQTGYGVYGESLTNSGVFGVAHSSLVAAVWGKTDSPTGYGVLGQATTGGIAGFFSSGPFGTALKTNGPLDIHNTGSTAGKVLMVDASGNANWEGAIAFSTKGTSTVAPSNTIYILPQNTEEFDISGNFLTNGSIVNPNTFTAPVNGVYHFDCSIIWTISPGEAYYAYTMIMVNAVEKLSIYHYAHDDADFSSQLSRDIKLNAGDKVSLACKSTSPLLANIYSSFFSGHLVFRQ